jgi:hypothetical protein
MKVKSQLCLLFATFMCSGLTLAADARGGSKQAGSAENMALVVGAAGEAYPIYGAGGIRVTGGHHGIFSSNLKSSAIEIDGSGISAQKYLPVSVSADFSASPNAAYFVSDASICTLPSAAGCAGQEIVVCNTSQNATITYQAASGETVYGGEQAGAALGAVVNSRQGKVDRFISDGKNWYRG